MPVCCLLTLILGWFAGQAAHSQATDMSSTVSTKVEAIPSSKLIFHESSEKTRIKAPSVVMNGPPQCGPDGLSFLLFMVNPPYYNERVVYSISSAGKAISYSPETAPGLSHVSVVYVDPGITNLVMLLRAQHAGDPIHSPLKYHLALFDYDGKLRHDAELDLAFDPIEIMQVDKDTLFVAGVDGIAGHAVFDFIDENGTILRGLKEETVMPSEQQLSSIMSSLDLGGTTPKGLPVAQQLSMLLSLFRPVHSERGLLILEPGIQGRVIEILRSGGVRQVKLLLPPNQVAQTMITRKGAWYVRTSLDGTEMDSTLYQIDPDSGKTLRQIDTSDVTSSSIACATESGFYGFRWIENNPYIIEGELK